MKTMLWAPCVAAVMVALTGCTQQPAGVDPIAETNGRIGVYDSRAVAIAFAGSEAFEKWLTALRAEHDKAKAAGDDKRVAELAAKGKNRQALAHKQAFSTAPVDEILEHITDGLPAIKAKAGVTAIVSKWDADTLAAQTRHRDSEARAHIAG